MKKLVLIFFALGSFSAAYAEPVQLDQMATIAAQALIDPSIKEAVSRIQVPSLAIDSISVDVVNVFETTITYSFYNIDPVKGGILYGGSVPAPLKVSRKLLIDGTDHSQHVIYKVL